MNALYASWWTGQIPMFLSVVNNNALHKTRFILNREKNYKTCFANNKFFSRTISIMSIKLNILMKTVYLNKCHVFLHFANKIVLHKERIYMVGTAPAKYAKYCSLCSAIIFCNTAVKFIMVRRSTLTSAETSPCSTPYGANGHQ